MRIDVQTTLFMAFFFMYPTMRITHVIMCSNVLKCDWLRCAQNMQLFPRCMSCLCLSYRDLHLSKSPLGVPVNSVSRHFSCIQLCLSCFVCGIIRRFFANCLSGGKQLGAQEGRDRPFPSSRSFRLLPLSFNKIIFKNLSTTTRQQIVGFGSTAHFCRRE